MMRRCGTSRWFLSVGILCGALGVVSPAAGQVPARPSLDDLVAEIQELHRRNICGPNIPLDPALLAKLDLVRGKSAWETIRLLKKRDPLNWPETLKASAYEKERVKIERLLPVAAKQAKEGNVSAELVREMDEAAKKLSNRLDEHVDDLSPDQYVESKRFSRQIDGTIAILQRKDIRDYFQAAEDLPVQCRTVQDLIVYVTAHQFRIVRPLWGPDYKNLMQALETYAEKARPRPAEKK